VHKNVLFSRFPEEFKRGTPGSRYCDGEIQQAEREGIVTPRHLNLKPNIWVLPIEMVKE
jgi:hypothetical protein